MSGEIGQFSEREPIYTVAGSSMSWNIPEQSDWQCWLLGTPDGVCYRPVKGKEPNWFWRKMHYLAFGWKWVKNPP